MEKKRKQQQAILLLIGLLLILAGVIGFIYNWMTQERFGVIRQNSLLTIPVDELPADTLYITPDRKSYQKGDMSLLIPAIEVDTLIGNSTEPDGLQEMPGLYEFAQLPGEGNVNVSIAGHRDIYDMVFYYLDRVAYGDLLYLRYQDRVFVYQYLDTRIVGPREWDVIEPQGFSCLTLTTCDPIGTSRNRLIVRGELIRIDPLTEDYVYEMNTREKLPA